MFLVEQINFTEDIQPAYLPDAPNTYLGNGNLSYFIAGWDKKGAPITIRFNDIDLSVSNDSWCRIVGEAYLQYDPKSQICK